MILLQLRHAERLVLQRAYKKSASVAALVTGANVVFKGARPLEMVGVLIPGVFVFTRVALDRANVNHHRGSPRK